MKKILYFTLTALAAVACNKDIATPENTNQGGNGEVTVIKATIDEAVENDGTRTTLADEEGNRYIRWSAEDQIGIYGGPSTQNTMAELDEDYIGEITGTFLVSGPFDSPSFAYYPYSENVLFAGGKVDGIVLPSTQKYVPGKVFGGTVCPMLGLYDNSSKSFWFKNACAIMEVQLTGSDKITSVELRSLDKPLAGKGSIAMNDQPVFQLSDQEVSYRIELTLDKSVQLSSKPTAFYFVVAPGEYSSLSVCAFTEEGNLAQKTSSSVHQLRERHILPMKSFSMGKPSASVTDLSAGGCANTYTVAPDGVGYYSLDVKHVDGKAFAKDEKDQSRNAAFADILWESESNLIGDVWYDAAEGKVYFRKIKTHPGSALVCIFNSEQTVLWSWTIWCSDVKDQTWGKTPITFQDRFLGATWVPANEDEAMGNTDANYVASTGFFYQYGRPVPTPGTNTLMPGVRYEGETVTAGTTNMDGRPINKDILKKLTWQPVFHNFYEKYSTGWNTRNQMWSVEENLSYPLSMNKLWLTDSEDYGSCWATGIHVTGSEAMWAENKTNYDPCPVGYRVPLLSELRNFINDGNGELEWVNGTGSGNKTTTNYFGAFIERETNFIWIPKAGFRTYGGHNQKNANAYSFTMAYWGNYRYSSIPWYDGGANMWVVNPGDTKDFLGTCPGYGGWTPTSKGDVHGRMIHMGGATGPKEYASGDKPYVGVAGEALSIRCVKIK